MLSFGKTVFNAGSLKAESTRKHKKVGAEPQFNKKQQKIHRSCNRIHDWGCSWECNYCYCNETITRLGISLQLRVFTHLVPAITSMGACVKCELFVYVKHTVHSSLNKFPLPPIYLLFLIALWKASWWSSVRFHAGGKIVSVWSRRQKYGQQNRISSLVSAILLHRDFPMGTHFCCANHGRISVGCFLSGHESREDGGGGGWGREVGAPLAMMIPEIHWAASWI